jgi:hypothetical protein
MKVQDITVNDTNVYYCCMVWYTSLQTCLIVREIIFHYYKIHLLLIFAEDQ